MMKNCVFLFVLAVSLYACEQTDRELPILGETTLDKSTGEVIHYQAPSFSFTSQLGQEFSDVQVKGKVSVVDFFFSSCPTICPQMTNHLKLVQDHFENEDRLRIISYSIDPKYDTPARLAEYADYHGINGDQWALLTGFETDVFEVAKDYKVRAFDDGRDEVPGLIHDGTFVLVDEQRRIRGYYNGLEPSEIDRLIDDIALLLKAM